MKPVSPGVDLSAEPTYDPDRGYYYTYIVPNILRDTYDKEGVVIPMRTVSSDCNTYLRVSSQLNADGTFPTGVRIYRSAILTIHNEAANNFNVSLSDGSSSGTTLNMKYGPNLPVNLHVSFPAEVLNYRPDGFTGFIATKNLKPAADETRLTEAVGGYIFKATSSNLTFKLVTRDVASEEEITVKESGNVVAFNPATVWIKNIRLTGTVELAQGTFDQNNPFMSLEREDGTRIGVLTVVSAPDRQSGTFTIDLRTEYKLDMDERIFIRYSPLTAGDTRLFTATTSIRDLQENSGDPIILMQR